MRANRGRSGIKLRRLAGVSAALVLLTVLAPSAGADLQQQLDDAKARLEQLDRKIEQQRRVLEALESKAAAVARRLMDARDAYDQITAELTRTRRDLDEASRQYRKLRSQLNERARETYMQGPGSPIEFLLGATSLSDLNDRVEYVDAVSQADADLANRVQNLKNQLTAEARDQQRLQDKRAEKLRGIQADQAEVDTQLAEAERISDAIERKRNEAKRIVQKHEKELAAYWKSHYDVNFNPNGVFKVCPVAEPNILTDSFGAPRYAGGFHWHAGNDILAAEGTPILAPFDGTARASSNTLGGLAVYVYGANGYVYNAHLSGYPDPMPASVHAGDVIGFVGNTGDAGTINHDHFEWHPDSIPDPDAWPRSPYGFSVIGSAVNPYPLLSQVC
ncbi:MAG: peptidoglycan DD-metalloendopeptidase family protein [Actinomycetota bacterium]